MIHSDHQSVDAADPNQIRILLVDDHFFVRMGLSQAINDEPDMTVVAEADSGALALELFQRLRPSVVLLDMHLLDVTGDQVLTQMRMIDESFSCVLFSVSICEEDICRGASSGASAYLPKSVSRDELIQAIRMVADGGVYFPPIVQEILERSQRRPKLTPREIQTLQCLVNGLSNKEIAKSLSISSATVKLHITHVFEKLGVEDRTQAVAEAITRGLSRPE